MEPCEENTELFSFLNDCIWKAYYSAIVKNQGSVGFCESLKNCLIGNPDFENCVSKAYHGVYNANFGARTRDVCLQILRKSCIFDHFEKHKDTLMQLSQEEIGGMILQLISNL